MNRLFQLQKIGIFKFEVFDESIKERATEVAGKFPGTPTLIYGYIKINKYNGKIHLHTEEV